MNKSSTSSIALKKEVPVPLETGLEASDWFKGFVEAMERPADVGEKVDWSCDSESSSSIDSECYGCSTCSECSKQPLTLPTNGITVSFGNVSFEFIFFIHLFIFLAEKYNYPKDF